MLLAGKGIATADAAPSYAERKKNACVPSCHNFSWMAEFPPFHCDKLDYIHYSAILWGFLCAKNLRHSNPSS